MNMDNESLVALARAEAWKVHRFRGAQEIMFSGELAEEQLTIIDQYFEADLRWEPERSKKGNYWVYAVHPYGKG